MTTKVKKVHPNQIFKYTQSLFKSERARVDGSLSEDFQAIMEGNAIYLESPLCAPTDFSILEQLMKDMAQEEESNPDNGGMINWSRHYKYENPEFSPTFRKIIAYLSDYFDVEVLATRLNFYPDASSWKPYHHDSHAYGAKGVKEDITVGVSFGDTRELSFLHVPSDTTFSFPQRNGDVFAFTSAVNDKFQHGVPRSKVASVGPRFSIIAWGRRRTINERNGGLPGSAPVVNPMVANDTEQDYIDENYANIQKPMQENSPGPSITEVVELVKKFVEDKRKEQAARASVSTSKGLRGDSTTSSGGGSTSGRGGRQVQRGGRIQAGAFRK